MGLKKSIQKSVKSVISNKDSHKSLPKVKLRMKKVESEKADS